MNSFWSNIYIYDITEEWLYLSLNLFFEMNQKWFEEIFQITHNSYNQKFSIFKNEK